MSEYICEKCDVFFDNKKMPSGERVIKRMTIDISVKEEVTRCRDCKHFTPKGTHKFGDNKVNADYCKYIRSYMLRVTPDGFCAWGERRDA